MRSIDLSHNLLEKLDNKTTGLFDDCLSLEKVKDEKISKLISMLTKWRF